ncbi:BAR/IMD domain-containing adapter protein 2-like 2 isoform X2 [Antennarius striatus]|uniref:BAR/IMD domain-containing adapter protein 2-like 2 isoform X2 n=1 Tax=Antennarius striatus TaxID=241820 RepID=UPI0035B1E109
MNMSGMNGDQLHRSTLGIYSSLMDDFNPGLQKLVSLGHSYIKAFQALAVTSEAYFSTLSKIGEKAFRSMSSRSLGDILMQMSENQRMVTMELETVYRWFSVEVIQEMDNSIRLDRDYISDSRKHYEVEVHHQAVTLERQLRRGANQDCSEYEQFLRKSHSEALKEEERRHRFLAEKHCGLIQSIAHLMNKTGGPLQQRADAWAKEVNATRGVEPKRPPSVDSFTGMREDSRWYREELTLGSIPSRAPSPVGSISRSTSESVGGGGGGRTMRARVAHQPGSSKPTLLPFSRGEMITVLVQQPRNGWLYGCTDSTSQQGWFPASYVEAVDDPPMTAGYRSSSMSDLPAQSRSRSGSVAPPPAPPPPPVFSDQHTQVQPITRPVDRGPESYSQHKRSKPHGSQPELFPRGANPFATVKLKPTATNDRSAPNFNRR